MFRGEGTLSEAALAVVLESNNAIIERMEKFLNSLSDAASGNRPANNAEATGEANAERTEPAIFDHFKTLGSVKLKLQGRNLQNPVGKKKTKVHKATLEGKNGNPFLDSFPNPLCKLNLKETSDFVKSLPATSNVAENRVLSRKEGVSSVTRNNMDALSNTGSTHFQLQCWRKFPSKWDDAEKWLVNESSFQEHKKKS
ncbi:hypothetical protein RND71_022755 [Anisodus tanguticus]|uniref:Uncharacterized protein n=1 Tax=Anisodus tanguticus TaxID=243964 RepID=A0AAE1VE40_9SOLA|nr:hypothetical protein RND71_022755 [Anisodus tanguticus]